jgi:uncharacterized protein YbjT (DUF2867 family)
MTKDSPILITGAGGQVGSVSRLIIENLRSQGYPIRAFVRKDDHRAQELRALGAEIFVGDLLDAHDVFEAVKGCRRAYFSMSLDPSYTTAGVLLAAALREQGDTEILVDMSQHLVAYLRPEEIRRDEVGLPPIDIRWSPQERVHWATERALEWSGIPVTHIQATIFVENPIYSTFPMQDLIERAELHLPLRDQKIALITAYDTAEACARVLTDPSRHQNTGYILTGPKAQDGHELAEEYSLALGKSIRYVAYNWDDWNKKYIDPHLEILGQHTATHLKHLNKLTAAGYFNTPTEQLEPLLERPAKTVSWALTRLFHRMPR